MNIYVKKQTKTILDGKTSCNAYSRPVNQDGSLIPCKFSRIKGDTICKHHSKVFEQEYIYDSDMFCINYNHMQHKIIMKIDYKNHILILKKQNMTEVYRFINDDTLYGLKSEITFHHELGFLDELKKRHFINTNKVTILNQCPFILDFFENEIKEVVDSVYPSYISDIIMSYTDIPSVKRIMYFYRLRNILNPLYKLNYDDMYIYLRFKFKYLLSWSEILVSKPDHIDLFYNTILISMLIYKNKLSIDTFTPLLTRLKQLKQTAYKQNYCSTPDIELIEI
jgi:hypothetical protein